MSFLNLEIDCIISDIGFYFELAHNLVSSTTAPITIFGFTPYFSLFTLETYSYIEKNFIPYSNALKKEHIKIVTASRARLKLLDGSELNISELFELLNWILAFYKRIYIDKHKGFFAPIRKLFQNDTGISIYDSHVIGSDQIGYLRTGLKSDNTSESLKDSLEIMYEVLRDIGSYINTICLLPEFKPKNNNQYCYRIANQKGHYIELKANQFISNIFNGHKSREVNYSLFYILTEVNFMKYVLLNHFKTTRSGLQNLDSSNWKA